MTCSSTRAPWWSRDRVRRGAEAEGHDDEAHQFNHPFSGEALAMIMCALGYASIVEDVIGCPSVAAGTPYPDAVGAGAAPSVPAAAVEETAAVLKNCIDDWAKAAQDCAERMQDEVHRGRPGEGPRRRVGAKPARGSDGGRARPSQRAGDRPTPCRRPTPNWPMGSPLTAVVEGYAALASLLVERWNERAREVAKARRRKLYG